LSLDCLNVEDKGIMLLQNVRNHIPNDKVSQAPRPDLLATPQVSLISQYALHKSSKYDATVITHKI
jgi:hypothetical protein